MSEIRVKLCQGWVKLRQLWVNILNWRAHDSVTEVRFAALRDRTIITYEKIKYLKVIHVSLPNLGVKSTSF